MHIQWQQPGQTLGQESRLTTSVMVNLRPRPPCTQRKTIIQLTTTTKNCFREIILTFETRQTTWCLTGLFFFLHLLSEEVEKAWSLLLPPQQDYVCGSEHTHTHIILKKKTFSLHGTDRKLGIKTEFSFPGQKVVNPCEFTSIQFAKAGIRPWARSLFFTTSAGHKLPSVYRHSSCGHITNKKSKKILLKLANNTTHSLMQILTVNLVLWPDR